MKTKVTLLGDSIRMLGYGDKVAEILSEDFEVFTYPENCKFSKYTYRLLHDWESLMEGSRIVHWNNGLWDVAKLFDNECFTSEEEYVIIMSKIADILLSRYERVIFSTTTPVKEGITKSHNADIIRYNELIVPVLKEKGVIINDLYSFVLSGVDDYIRDDDHVHLTQAGIDACAKQISDLIVEVSKTLK